MPEVIVSCLLGSLSHRDSQKALESGRELTSHQQLNHRKLWSCAFSPFLIGVFRELPWHSHTLPEPLRYQHQPEPVVEWTEYPEGFYDEEMKKHLKIKKWCYILVKAPGWWEWLRKNQVTQMNDKRKIQGKWLLVGAVRQSDSVDGTQRALVLSICGKILRGAFGHGCSFFVLY